MTGTKAMRSIGMSRRYGETGPRSSSTAWAQRLDRNGTLRIPHGTGGAWLRVEQGQVVVTLEGDAEDHVLSAGEELVLGRGGLAVAWALEASALRGGELHGLRVYGHDGEGPEASAA
jgi:hypothetical protein